MATVMVLVPFPMSEENRAQREAQKDAVKLGPSIDFHFRPVKAAPANYVSHHDSVLADMSILEAGLKAQEEGYDAVCIDTMSDSGMAALRSVLDIPVISPGRASMLTALMLGDRFSVIAMWDEWKPLYRKTLAELGLWEQCASLRAINVRPDNRNLLAGKEDEVFPLLAEAASRCVSEDGADVILLGSTTMHQAHAHLVDALPVPVINPGPLTYKLAEAAIDLGLTHSRRAYPKPLAQKNDMIQAMMTAAAASEKSA